MKDTKMLKMLGIIATVLGLAVSTLSDYVEEKMMEATIEEKVREALAETETEEEKEEE